jgi:hypothetical protein
MNNLINAGRRWPGSVRVSVDTKGPYIRDKRPPRMFYPSM